MLDANAPSPSAGINILTIPTVRDKRPSIDIVPAVLEVIHMEPTLASEEESASDLDDCLTPSSTTLESE